MLDIGKRLDRMNRAKPSNIKEAVKDCCENGTCGTHGKTGELTETTKITKSELRQLIKEAMREAIENPCNSAR
jgi:hypothetical protein